MRAGALVATAAPAGIDWMARAQHAADKTRTGMDLVAGIAFPDVTSYGFNADKTAFTLRV